MPMDKIMGLLQDGVVSWAVVMGRYFESLSYAQWYDELLAVTKRTLSSLPLYAVLANLPC